MPVKAQTTSAQAITPGDELEKRQQAVALIQRWLDDASDHDEKVWPVLAEELKDSRLRCRE